MPQIELDRTQTILVREILASYLSDLRMEIADSDSMDVREKLKRDEAILKDILARLPA